jgi:hypothetical protein
LVEAGKGFPMAKRTAKIDPELAAQVARSPKGQLVDAMLVLRAKDGTHAALSPEQAIHVGRELLARATKLAQRQPEVFETLEEVGYVVVSADAGFLQILFDQPEVASAMANREVPMIAVREKESRRRSR